MIPAILLILAADPSVTVVSPDDQPLAMKAAATPELPVALTVGRVPAAQPTPTTPPDDTLAQARKAWVSADFVRCLKLLEDDAAVTSALARGDRTTAARTLAWRVACKLSARQADGARRDGEWLAALQLPPPEDVGVMTPDVEALLTGLRRAIDGQLRVQVTVTSPVKDAVVALDGRPAACIVPCRMPLAAGVHVVQVSADGYTPMARPITVTGAEMTVEVTPPPADPSLAATQWHERRAAGDTFDSGRSMQLLTVALRSARLLVVGPAEAPGLVRGALAVDGVVQARGERDDVQALVADLLVRGKIVEPQTPLWKRWPFWVAVGAAAVATGVTAAVLVANRPVITRVELNP